MQNEPFNSLSVSIFGADYPLKNVNNPDSVSEIAKYVDRQMREVAGSISLRSASKVAVMAAMRISTEMFAIQDELDRLRALMKEHAQTLDRALASEKMGVDIADE